MTRPDPIIAFFCLLVAWGLLMALIVGGCGGSQRPCAASRTGDGSAEPCDRKNRSQVNWWLLVGNGEAGR